MPDPWRPATLDPWTKAILRVARAWDIFKASHNIEEAELRCCDRTVELFEALDRLTTLIEETEE